MDVVNDTVHDPVLIRCARSTTPSRLSSNTYYDYGPDPRGTSKLDPKSLTALERGHVYLWRRRDQATLLIRCPYRYVDTETAKLLQGLKSFKSEGTRAYGTVRQRSRPVSALHEFSMNDADFATFQRRLTALGGSLRRDEVDLQAVRADLDALGTAESMMDNLRTYRSEWCRDPGVHPIESPETLQSVLSELDVYEGRVAELRDLRLSTAKLLDSLSKDVGRREQYLIHLTEFDGLVPVLEELPKLDFERYRREATHKYRAVKAPDAVSRPDYMGTLSEEVASLKRVYPALHRIYVNGATVIVDLPGVKIHLNEEGGCSIKGDIIALKPYIEEMATAKKTTRRRRTIMQVDSPESA